MPGDCDVLITFESVSFNVVIPKGYVWEFMKYFGSEFPKKELGVPDSIRPVDSYRSSQTGWTITCTVPKNEKQKFYQFLRDFCCATSLSYRDPETHEIVGNIAKC